VKRRRSRRKKLSDAQLARAEQTLATGNTEIAPGIDYGPEIRPKVDRDALLRAVDYAHFDWTLHLLQTSRAPAEGAISPEAAARWRTLARLRAIQRECADWIAELGGNVEPAQPGDSRSRRVSKGELFAVVKGRRPANSAEASRWFAQHRSKLDPEPNDPLSRAKVTVNLRMLMEHFPEADPARLR
jgi:hypothetical protein